ncbi:unnamed protein product [Rhizoctonia solani]|uniref:Uncharacterized protein n=1 Tax=Rhizoctonia solani TaxID=456999 RepID=A0A8H3BAZ1_9AGAM|nr:unnamed protein product [Rhizoctonia solani]
MLGDSCMFIQECGQPGLHDVYEALRVRLCLSCSFERLAPVPRIPLELQDLLHKSTGEFYEKWYGGLPPPVVYSLRNEVSEVEEKIKELVKMGDQVALESWKKERSSAVRERTKETEELQRFLYKREATRRPEPVGPRYICCSACG